MRPVPVGHRSVRCGHRFLVHFLPEAARRAVLAQREVVGEERDLFFCRPGGVEGVEDALAALLVCFLFVYDARARDAKVVEG